MTASPMTDRETELWNHIQSFPLDQPGVALPYSARLARENGWRRAHAARVIEEYRRFLFLAARAGHPVSPSDEVDQAWHLHLVYTRSYWRDLCEGVLGFPLHHEPTEGGVAETGKYQDWYAKTLASYRRYFGEPPADVWPAPEARLKSKREQWVDVSRHWVLPRPKFLRRANPMLLAGAATALLLMAVLPGCIDLTNVFNATGPDFLGFFVVSFVIALVASFILPAWVKGRSEEVSMDDVSDPYEVAFLGAGGPRAVDAAFASLYGRHMIGIKEQKTGPAMVRQLPGGSRDDLHEIEKVVYRSIPKDRECSMRDVRRSVTASLEATRQRLENAGLLMNPSQRRQISWVAAAPFLLLLTTGLIKIFIGSERHKPIMFLCFLCLGTFVVMCFRAAKVNKRTARGEALWRKLQSRQKPDMSQQGVSAVPMTVALLGAGALLGSHYAPMRTALKRPGGEASSGCGSGSSCGGGSCGGSSSDGGGGGGDSGGSSCSSGCGGCGGGGGD